MIAPKQFIICNLDINFGDVYICACENWSLSIKNAFEF